MSRLAATLRPPWPALLAAGLYVVFTATLPDGTPLVRFPAFRFPVAEGATAVLLVRADGEPASIDDLEGFYGLAPDDVDVRHQGVACSVEHTLYEAQRRIADHPGEAPGPVNVEIGLRILAINAEGQLVSTERVDAAGSARWAR